MKLDPAIMAGPPFSKKTDIFALMVYFKIASVLVLK